MIILLEQKTYDVLYNNDPNDDVCQAEALDFINEIAELQELAEKLYKDIISRDEELKEEYKLKYGDDGEAVFSIAMARKELAYLNDKYPSINDMPEIKRGRMRELNTILNSF